MILCERSQYLRQQRQGAYLQRFSKLFRRSTSNLFDQLWTAPRASLAPTYVLMAGITAPGDPPWLPCSPQRESREHNLNEKALFLRQPKSRVYSSGDLPSKFGSPRRVQGSFLYNLLARVLFSKRIHTSYHQSKEDIASIDGYEGSFHKEFGGRRCPAAGVFDKRLPK